jgi:hypothetical protein
MKPPSLLNPEAPLDWRLSPRLLAGLSLLAQAQEYAQEVGCDVWEFAVELPLLVGSGLSLNDLRLLVRRGLVAHAVETTSAGAETRTFVPEGRLSFAARSCFILTKVGAGCTRLPEAEAGTLSRLDGAARSDGQPTVGLPKPDWDVDLRTLRVGTAVVKHYEQPAPCQEAILAAFQEQLWIEQIDDPLPGVHGQNPKQRLHNTVQNLNRNQTNPLLDFGCCKNGQGVSWRHRGPLTQSYHRATPELP